MVYTIDGYLAALRFREKPTLMVEGETDRIFSSRLLHELDCRAHLRKGRVVVDTAQILRSDNGLGSREKVEAIHSATPDLRDSFAAFVDREYRDFTFYPAFKDDCPRHNVIDTTLFWTRGHSVENYIFTTHSVLGFLRLQFADLIDAATEQLIEVAFAQLCLWAASISVAVFQKALINRSVGIALPTMWNVASQDVSNWTFNVTEFSTRLVGRGVAQTDADAFVATATQSFALLSDIDVSNQTRWILHGHVGWELLWSGVAAIMSGVGASATEVDQIFRGYRELKLRIAFDRWVSEQINSSAGLDGSELPATLIQWLCEVTSDGIQPICTPEP